MGAKRLYMLSQDSQFMISRGAPSIPTNAAPPAEGPRGIVYGVTATADTEQPPGEDD